MKALIDTSIFLWLINEPNRLNTRARSVLSSPESHLYLSAASCWEIIIKTRAGKLRLDMPAPLYIQSWQTAYNIVPLPILQSHAFALHDMAELAGHKDPFDRMLVAQAATEDMVLLTSDRALEKYDVRTLWAAK